MFTQSSFKFYSIALLALALNACDNSLQFSELLQSCTPPKSSARYGKNQGPIITSPDALTPSKGSQLISGTCVTGEDVTVSGNGVTEDQVVPCTNGSFSANVIYNSGDGTKEVDVSQKTSDDGVMDRLCFEKDTVPPKVKISGSSGAQSIGKTTVTLNGSCESGLPVQISGPNLLSNVETDCNNGQFSASISFTGKDGLKNVLAVQVDKAGNNGQDDKDYLTDTVAPTVRIQSPTNSSYSTGLTDVSGTCESGLEVILLGTAVSNQPIRTNCVDSKFLTTLKVPSPDGTKNILAQQSDAAGNTGRDERFLVLDATAPMISFTAPNFSNTTQKSTNFAGSCESGLQLKLSGPGLKNNVTTSCSNAQFSVTANLSDGDGEKQIIANQTDAAGNIGVANKSLSLDTAAPLVKITSPEPSQLVKTHVDLRGSCESGIQVTINGAGADGISQVACTNSSFAAKVKLSKDDGTKEIIASQTDPSGNTGTDRRSFIRDESAPSIQIQSPVNNSSSTGAMTLTGICETNLDIQFSGDIANQLIKCSNGSFSINIDLLGDVGTKQIIAEQTDKNGNRGFDKKMYRKVNNLGYLTFSSPGPGGLVDILFIDDNSVSMEQEQKRLGERFASFALELKDYDWQAGITTTDCSSSDPSYNICGSLLNFTGTNSYILKQSTPNYLDVFQKTIQRPETYNPDTGFSCDIDPNGKCPSGFEEPLRATKEAISKINGDNKGFFRDRADLAVVVLSDEDESGSTTPQDVVDQFKRTFSSDKKLSVYGIIVKPGDAACFKKQESQSGKGNSQYGTKITEFARIGGGFTSSICESDFTLTLREIGQNVTKLNRTVLLQNVPIKNSVRVVFTPDWKTKFVVEDNKVIFDDPAPKTTKVEIFYEY